MKDMLRRIHCASRRISGAALKTNDGARSINNSASRINETSKRLNNATGRGNGLSCVVNVAAKRIKRPVEYGKQCSKKYKQRGKSALHF
ncbi:MAG: hypothetical protein IJ684_00465 [Bacteroidales bacterium]|nr:hypothetical protein [Bacteroidales bacterium]